MSVPKPYERRGPRDLDTRVLSSNIKQHLHRQD